MKVIPLSVLSILLPDEGDSRNALYALSNHKPYKQKYSDNGQCHIIFKNIFKKHIQSEANFMGTSQRTKMLSSCTN